MNLNKKPTYQKDAQRYLSRMGQVNRQLAEKYLRIRRLQGLKPGTLGHIARALQLLDDFLPDSRRIDEVTADEMMDFLTDLDVRMSVPTRITYSRNIRKYLKDTWGEPLPADMATVLYARDPPPNDNANLVSEQDLQALLDACEKRKYAKENKFHAGVMYKALVHLLWASGLRISEALSLKWGRLDFDDIGVGIRLDPNEPNLKTGPRNIYVTEPTLDLLHWKDLTPHSGKLDYVFLSQYKTGGNHPLGATSADGAMKRLAKIAGLFQDTRKPLSCHDFRHSAATRKAQVEGLVESDLRTFFGWSPRSSMPSRYVHQNQDRLRELARAAHLQRVEQRTRTEKQHRERNSADVLLDLLRKALRE